MEMCVTSFCSALTSILVSSDAPDRESAHPPFQLTAFVSVSQSVEKVGVPASAAQIICFTEASVPLTSQSAPSHDSTDLIFFFFPTSGVHYILKCEEFFCSVV